MHTYIVTMPGGARNTIVADQSFVELYYSDAWELVPDAPQPEPPPPSQEECLRQTANEFLLGLTGAIK